MDADPSSSYLQSAPPEFNRRLGIQQRVLPAYRVDFFESLARACGGRLSVIAGYPQDHESIVVAEQLSGAGYVRAQNIHIGSVHQPYYLCWQRGLLNWLQEWQPDILVVEANPRYLSTRRAVSWMHRRQRPVIGWGLGAPSALLKPAGFMGFLRGFGRSVFYKMFDGMIAYSQRGAEEYRALGFPAQRVFVAPNAVVHRPVENSPARPHARVGRQRALFVGRLQWRKRVDNLLHACAGLVPALQPQLIIVGDGPARAELQQLARDIYPQAEFPGAVHGQALEQFFADADLFILPGTGGLAVPQAMGHGLPVIVAEGDGTQDDLVRPENGWRVPPNDLPALQNALREALSDLERLRKMGRESQRIVRDEFNIEAMVAGFLTAVTSITTLG
jgi:glycosyltransferase involved in cell wall biosynthesis